MKLDGKSVLLTGATGGLGRAIAKALADRGALMILSSRKQAELDELAASLPWSGHRTIVSDLAEEGADLALLAEAGDIDGFVANAALPGSGRIDSYSHGEIERVLRVNLDAPIRMTRELLPSFRERGSGHLVFVSSIFGRISGPRSALYASTKFGLRGFAFCLREDLRRSGVGVSVISPGAIRDAGMFADSGAPPPPGLGTGTPEQVGKAVVEVIERDKREITVAPLRQRVATWVAATAPEISGRLARRTATRVADRVASGQTEKR